MIATWWVSAHIDLIPASYKPDWSRSASQGDPWGEVDSEIPCLKQKDGKIGAERPDIPHTKKRAAIGRVWRFYVS
jgi:hypothetical protein